MTRIGQMILIYKVGMLMELVISMHELWGGLHLATCQLEECRFSWSSLPTVGTLSRSHPLVERLEPLDNWNSCFCAIKICWIGNLIHSHARGTYWFCARGRIIRIWWIWPHYTNKICFGTTNASSSVLLNVVQAFTWVIRISMFVDANGTCGGASLFCDSFSSFGCRLMS